MKIYLILFLFVCCCVTSVSANSDMCAELEMQNASLRETIRAQNEYLLSKDNSGKINNQMANENADLKNKVFYLEKGLKSSSAEIKKLMILNEKLEKELAQYRPQKKSK